MSPVRHVRDDGVVEHLEIRGIRPPAPTLPGAVRVIHGQRGGSGRRIGIVWHMLSGGGVETVNKGLAQALSREKWTVDGIVLRADEKYLDDARAFDDFVVLNAPWETPGLDTPLREMEGFQSLLIERNYDALIMSNCYSPFFVAKQHGTPIVEIWHGLGGWNAWRLPSDRIVAVSEATLRTIEPARPQHAPATIIHNGVDPERWAQVRGQRKAARKWFGIDKRSPVMLFCGRFSDEKRPGDAMRAFVLARKRNPDLKLLMVGTVFGGWNEHYIEMGQQIGLNWGVDAWHYELARDEVGQAYAASDVLVHTSTTEGFPMVVLEAMAAGLPVVSTYAGGTAEALEGVGYQAEVGNVRDLAEGIDSVLMRPQLRKAMAAAGQAKILREFTLKHQAEQYDAVLEELLS